MYVGIIYARYASYINYYSNVQKLIHSHNDKKK